MPPRFLGVSDDTVRRWVDSGALEAETDEAGRKVVDGYQVALLARDQAHAVADPSGRRVGPPATGSSAWSPTSSATP